MRKLVTITLGLVFAVALAESIAAQVPVPTFHYVTMSDGATIALRVHYPPDYVAGLRYPVLFTMEGYGGAGGHNDSTFNDDHDGYMLVAASLRGTGCSDGQLDLFSERSSLDGKELIDEWMPTQPWFDGEVAIFGHSYAGLTGFLIAATSPANLEATAVSGLIDDFYRGILYPGGVPNPGFPILWGAGVRPALEHTANGDELLQDPQCVANYADHQASDLAAAGTLQDTYLNREAAEDSWAIQRGLLGKIDGIRVPIQINQQYQDEQTGPRGGHVLWEHLPPELPRRFVVSTGRHNPNDPTATKKDWIDCWVRHDGNPSVTLGNGRRCADVLDPAKRVLAFFESKGGDRYTPHIASDWPLPDTLWTRYYLRSDGTLSTDASGGDGSVVYASSGTATQTTTGDVGGLAGSGSLGDVTYRPELPDTARYTLDFDEPTAIAGPAVLTLWASATSTDVDFFVEVLDEDVATGELTFVQRGLQRASLRETDDARSQRTPGGEVYRPYHDFVGPQLVVPGEVNEYQIEVFPFGHVFREGHRMRLQIHAPPANDPISTYAYEPNQAGVVTILQEPGRRSSLLLAVMPALPPLRPGAPGCGQVIGEICLQSF